ncbi:sodium-coupled monocarboxylate transporter 2 [Trichonephila clavipes]|nr:sodium-coupled monocarboxylate transporter 2 [Trichonephila clavipes]
MKNEKLILDAVDYVFLGATLCVSAGIGLFFQMTSKKTNEEYLLAGKDMSVFPVAFSLMATFMSSTNLMGVPAEMYIYGTNMVFMNFGFVIGPILVSHIFLPVYFVNNVSTAYEPDGRGYELVSSVRALVPQKFSVEEELMHVKHVDVKSPHVGVMWKFGRGVISSGIVLVN